MAISQGKLSKIFIVGGMWIFLGTLWGLSNWSSHPSFSPVTRYVPASVRNSWIVPESGQTKKEEGDYWTRKPATKNDSPSPELGGKSTFSEGVAGGRILPALAKAAGRVKEKISFDSISEDERRRPWRYPARKDRKQLGTESATLLMLARNADLYAVRESMRRLEDRFNHQFRYPWTFMNDRPFTQEFIDLTSSIASGKTEYVQVPREQWGYPKWVNQTKARENMREMAQKQVIYGGSLSYRHMCRFFSGFFFRHPVLDKYEWYWRVEPGVNFFCDQHYDPFRWLRENGKSYGFTVVLHDFRETIATLWRTTEKFFSENPQYINPNGMRSFLVQNDTRDGKPYEEYNTCHFWTNFEIAKVSLWRSEKYMKYFEYLDNTGNFFYERWGDAPVHSIALAHMWDKKEIHFFNDIGYEHNPFRRCPKAHEHGTPGRCLCPLDISVVDENGFSCFDQWKNTFGQNYEIDLTW